MESSLFIAKNVSQSSRLASRESNEIRFFAAACTPQKNTLRVVECRSHAYGVARRETQRTFFIKKGRRPF